jgi:signal transduction histidine kinase
MSANPCGTILVIEDNLVNRRVLQAKLTDAGYACLCRESGPEALALLRSDAGAGIDLVVLDVMMPGMDGLEVLQRIRELRPRVDLPVIMATSLDKSADVVRALEAGANDYVTKPIDLAVLLSRLATHLELKRVHAELRASHRFLVEAAKMESVALLAAGVAHEIRNPLAQIKMGLDALTEAGAQGDRAGWEQVTALMRQSVDRADGIVRGLMATAANQKLKTVPGQVNEVVQETWKLVSEDFAKRGVSGQFDLGSTLPPVAYDPSAMRRVLLHLFLNAAQAMERGGAIAVTTRQEKAAGLAASEGARGAGHLRNGAPAVAVEISDEGPGVTNEVLERMFDPFFTTRAAGSGIGLGLTVVRKLMELHGGAVQVQNRTDRSGLTVKLLLPVSRLGLL